MTARQARRRSPTARHPLRAAARRRRPAQVKLRWSIKPGRPVVPPLDTDQHGGPEPEAITLEAFGRPILQG